MGSKVGKGFQCLSVTIGTQLVCGECTMVGRSVVGLSFGRAFVRSTLERGLGKRWWGVFTKSARYTGRKVLGLWPMNSRNKNEKRRYLKALGALR